MTNTPPSKSPDDAADGSAAPDSQTPVFDDGTADHSPAPDAAPELIEPEPVAPVDVPLASPATAESATTVQDASSDTAETVGYDEHIDEPRPKTDEYADTERAAAEPATAERAVAEPAVTEPVQAESAAAPPVPPRPAEEPVYPGQPVQTVYVPAPTAPRKKGNRGYGLLFGLLALIAFALLFVGVMAIVLSGIFPGDFADRLVRFVSSTAFIVPLAVFIVAFILLVLVTNRAGWWAWVLGSFLVAVVVYFGSIGVILLTGNVFGMTPAAATASFWTLAASPSIIIATILAREVTIWFGAAVSARGRKVKERNLEAQAAYERELDNQPLGFS